jgi:hypothetical protein
LPDFPVVTAENGELDEIPPRCFQKLPLSAEIVDAAFSFMAAAAKTYDQHFVLGDPLVVEMDDMMLLLDRSSADAIRVFPRGVIAIAALSGVHAVSLCLQPRAVPQNVQGSW